MWKISKCTARLGIDFLSEEIDIIGVIEHRFKHAVRFFEITRARQEVCLPKTANTKRAFTFRFCTIVAVH